VKAVNLTAGPVELDPINGPGMLAPATEDSDGLHERELVEVTARERGLADAHVIALLDSAGRRRNPDPPAAPDPADGGTPNGGE
jgi:hypothetical protein